jgi:hypothetical protein
VYYGYSPVNRKILIFLACWAVKSLFMGIWYCEVLLCKHFDEIVVLIMEDMILDVLLKASLADPLCITLYLATRTTPIDTGANIHR